jgi:hypothetical protein
MGKPKAEKTVEPDRTIDGYTRAETADVCVWLSAVRDKRQGELIRYWQEATTNIQALTAQIAVFERRLARFDKEGHDGD